MSLNRRSRNITEGVQRAPNRSMYYGLGYEEADFRKPMVGIANAHSTITPCNAGLQKLADAAEEGLREAGAIVIAHMLAVLLSHAIALKHLKSHRKAVLSQLPVAAFMVAYTFFGLWILAQPTGA